MFTVVHSAVASFGTIFVDGAKIDKASDNTVSKMCYIINPMIWEHILLRQYCMQAITHIWLFFYYCCFKHGPAPFNLYLYFFSVFFLSSLLSKGSCKQLNLSNKGHIYHHTQLIPLNKFRLVTQKNKHKGPKIPQNCQYSRTFSLSIYRSDFICSKHTVGA